MLKRWDIFCKVVDNFGDIGVCWRLCRQLRVEHGLDIRLWIDDLEAAQKIIPSLNIGKNNQFCEEITILKLGAEVDFCQAADVVIEAFACELPPAYLAAMLRQQSKWVNLEYLSAETWVEDFHAKPSPQNFLNSNQGLIRHFYFPGFTEATGGLLRECDISSQLGGHTNPRPLAGEGARQRGRGNLQKTSVNEIKDAPLSNLSPASGREALKASLFCYPHAPIHALLDAFAESTQSINCYVPASSILPQIADYFEVATIEVGDHLTRENLDVHILPFLSQANYDQLLADCDLNFVRGEDSWVRAIWAGKSFIWQPYFQDENAHIKKLNAFLDLFYANLNIKETVCEAHRCWSVGQLPKQVWNTYLERLAAISGYTLQQSQQLAKQQDLAAKLVIFCNKI